MKTKLFIGALSVALLLTGITFALPAQTRPQQASASQTSIPTPTAPAETPKPVYTPDYRTDPVAGQPQPTTPAPAYPKNPDGSIQIPSTPENSICQYPYYQLPNTGDVTVCALSDGYTDCNNFTAVPNGQTCDPATAPKPYVDPTVSAGN